MIDILMATYNGGQFIERQILSLIGQSFKSWNLLIHDDGSNDETLWMISKYCQLDNRITLLNDGVKFGNAGENFMHLLSFSKSEYIIFCDQDDIWLENKLEILYEEISRLSNKKPKGVFVGGYLFSLDKGVYGKIPSVRPTQVREALFLNGGLQGCSLMFNSACRYRMLQFNSDSISMHDHLLMITLLSFGNIIYLDKYLMLYRQNHINKVTSNIETNKLVKIKNQILSKDPVLEKSHYNLNVNFFNQFKDDLSSEHVIYYEDFFRIVKSNNKFNSIKLVVKNGFKIGGSSIKLILKILLRPLL